ncbi:hypothetical protein QTJ16_003014 [Diplocarpon rosae]|uniref:Uncharacterized protein n=1 Tax=Diplocarpon rosae TaxID=946125 RepID=A0AAD9WFL1_9HELO|nr:hypothetical protein QTJ16_003014 [Diplocarpon rosae]
MAAVPKSLAETGRRDSSSSQKRAALSHGRGGAGNFNASAPDPISLETPTLKSEHYTTGRGGSGNMAKNESAEEARRAQDVVGRPRRESGNNTHVGRGGAANVFVFKPSPADLEQRGRSAEEDGGLLGEGGSRNGGNGNGGAHGKEEDEADRERSKGLADRGKEWIMGRLGK